MADKMADNAGGASKSDPRVPHGGRYLALLAGPPAQADWWSRVSVWPALADEKANYSAVSALAHCILQWTTYTQPKPKVMSRDEVLTTYSMITGADGGANDRPALPLDVLTYWMRNPVEGNALLAFGWIDPKNVNEVKASVAMFGNAYTRVALPASAKDQDVWDVAASGAEEGVGEPGSWGAKVMPIVGYDVDGALCVTPWGALRRMTWAFLQNYASEAWVLLDSGFVSSSGMIPGGLDANALKDDMQALVEDWPVKDGVVVNPHEEQRRRQQEQRKQSWDRIKGSKAKGEANDGAQTPMEPLSTKSKMAAEAVLGRQ